MPKRPAAGDATVAAPGADVLLPQRTGRRRVLAHASEPGPGAVLEMEPGRSRTCDAPRPREASRSVAPPQHRPAGARAATTHLCHGRADAVCRYSTAMPGERARYHDSSMRCPWCSDVLLEAALATQRGRAQMSRSLRYFWGHDKAVYHSAVQRLPESRQLHWPLQCLGLPPSFHSAEALAAALGTSQGCARVLAALRKRQATDPDLIAEALKAVPAQRLAGLQAKLAQEPRRRRQARARAAAETVEQQWDRLLAGRRRLRSPACLDTESSVFAERVTEDRARYAASSSRLDRGRCDTPGAAGRIPSLTLWRLVSETSLRTTQACLVLT